MITGRVIITIFLSMNVLLSCCAMEEKKLNLWDTLRAKVSDALTQILDQDISIVPASMLSQALCNEDLMLSVDKEITWKESQKKFLLVGIRSGGILLVQEAVVPTEPFDEETLSSYYVVAQTNGTEHEHEAVTMARFNETIPKIPPLPIIELHIKEIFVPNLQIDDKDACYCAELIRMYVFELVSSADVICLCDVNQSSPSVWYGVVILNGKKLHEQLLQDNCADKLTSQGVLFTTWKRDRIYSIIEHLKAWLNDQNRKDQRKH